MFLKHFLGVSEWKREFYKDQLQFLNKLIKLYLLRFPFQNISSFGRYRPVDRAPPGLREMLEANFGGGGGLCGHSNVFLMHTLESLGYDTIQLQGSFVRTPVPLSHNLFKVKIPGRAAKGGVVGDRNYIVDVGCGIPLHEAICIEELPFVGRGGGFDYVYDWAPGDKTVIKRRHLGGDPLIGPRGADTISPQDYTISLRGVKFVESKGPIAAVYCNPRNGVFLHQGLYLFRYLSFGPQPQEFQAVCIRGKQLILITKEGRSVEDFPNYAALRSQIHKYFPMIPPPEVELTIEHFDMDFEQALSLPSANP